MAMTSVCQKSICIHQDCRNEVLMFTIKEVWNRVSSPENQFFNISSCKWPSNSPLKSFTWFWWGIDELLPIYFSSDEHVQYMTSQNLLILIDFDSFIGHFLIWNYSPLNLYNSGTRRDIKKQSTAFILVFAALSNSVIKKTFHLHFKRNRSLSLND